ncbi:chromosome segregation protein SMC, partial [Candidatus Micrarchaeota archaeon]|nr:chromosome segregation protein SMC [Candidatus Micrarchaeota archaeon]
NVEKKLNGEKKTAEDGYADIEKRISETDAKRMEFSRELQGKQKTSEMIRKIEELKASMNIRLQTVKEREEGIRKIEEEQKGLKAKTGDEKKEISGIEEEIEKSRKELKALEAEAANEKITGVEEKLAPLRKEISEAEEKLQKSREQGIALQSEISSKKEMLASKEEDLKSLKPGNAGQEGEPDFEAELNGLTGRRKSIDEEIDESFRRTKEINKEISEMDRELLELKEKASIFKVRSSPQLMNPALRFVDDLKKDGGNGIYGTVADLLEFEPKYAQAIEAAGGSRLMYVVVDSSYTAVGIIEKLKKAGAGRATFIPLDVIKAPAELSAGGFSSVLKRIKCRSEVRKALEYVFGDTLLIEGSGDARKVGIGNYRMVTVSGEIFERSGVISGGKAQSSILTGNEAKKVEDALAKLKDEKNAFIEELYSLRESESKLRAERSQVEIRIKIIEMEIKAVKEQESGRMLLEEKRKNLEKSVKELAAAIETAEKDTEKLKKESERLKARAEDLRAKLAGEESQLRRESDEQNRMKIDIASQLSSLKATVEGKLNEVEIRKKNVHGTEHRIAAIAKESESLKKDIEKAGEEHGKESDELGLLEKKIAETGKKIEKLFESIKQHELELQELGKERERKRMELERVARELAQLGIKKATADTRLEDIKAEYERYKDTQFLDGLTKTKLQESINECEQALAGLGNVNMAAIEMYDKKKAEIDEITQKIDQLSEERKAIFRMVEEIEERKKEAFFEAFYAVSENFKKMFQYVDIGEGHLALDKPNEPFDSGLFIKINKGGHDYSIDALSGGEITLVTLMFIFALQFFKPSPFYILDEVDAALDKPNSKNLAQLIKSMAEKSQFILVSHNDTVISLANTVFGVSRTDKVSKIVGLKLKEMAAA